MLAPHEASAPPTWKAKTRAAWTLERSNAIFRSDEIREEKCTRKASGADRMLPGAGCVTPAADADTPATNPLKTTLSAEA